MGHMLNPLNHQDIEVIGEEVIYELPEFPGLRR